jgi:hypothetical protein
VSAVLFVPLAGAKTTGTFTTISPPGAVWSAATGVNNGGVGFYTDSSDNDHGFTYLRGTFTTIDAPARIPRRVVAWPRPRSCR